jgi:hypothetical protein
MDRPTVAGHYTETQKTIQTSITAYIFHVPSGINI